MKKHLSYLLLCAAFLGQSSSIVSATSVKDNVNEQSITQAEQNNTTSDEKIQAESGRKLGYQFFSGGTTAYTSYSSEGKYDETLGGRILSINENKSENISLDFLMHGTVEATEGTTRLHTEILYLDKSAVKLAAPVGILNDDAPEYSSQIRYSTDNKNFSKELPENLSEVSAIEFTKEFGNNYVPSTSAQVGDNIEWHIEVMPQMDNIQKNTPNLISYMILNDGKNTKASQTYINLAKDSAEATVKYVDSTGKQIGDSKTISGEVGDDYDATTDEYKLKIDGYTLDESKLPINTTGKLTADSPTITYVYNKDAVTPVQGGNVTVHYQDESGKTISDDVILKGNVGETYSSTKKDIKNYSFKEVKGSATGKFTDKAQSVTYVYKSTSTPVTTNVVYRLYNPNTGEHFYPTSKYERDETIKAGWRNEGTLETAPTSGKPIYRVYNPNAKGGDHYYTLSKYEATELVSKGWKWDYNGKPVFYSGGTKKVYVAYNPNAQTGAHNYTMSSFEQNSLLNIGWKYGATAWYAVK